MTPIKCEQCLELLDGYRRGTLTQDNIRRVDEHLLSCHECKTELELRNRLKNLLHKSLPPPKHPTALPFSVRKAIASGQSQPKRPALLPWMLTAAVLIVGAIAFFQINPSELPSSDQAVSPTGASESKTLAYEPRPTHSFSSYDSTLGTASEGDVFRTLSDGQLSQDKQALASAEHSVRQLALAAPEATPKVPVSAPLPLPITVNSEKKSEQQQAVESVGSISLNFDNKPDEETARKAPVVAMAQARDKTGNHQGYSMNAEEEVAEPQASRRANTPGKLMMDGQSATKSSRSRLYSYAEPAPASVAGGSVDLLTSATITTATLTSSPLTSRTL